MHHLTSAFLVCTLTLISVSSEAKRHSLVRRSERIEQRKKVIVTDDETLATLLKKQTKNMTFTEAARAFEYYDKKDAEMQIKCGQRLLAVGGDQEIVRKTRLALAELYLEKRGYKDTEKYALDYQKLYPGTPESLRAEFLAIQSNFLSKLSFDRDQQRTRTALRLAEEFLEKHPDEKEYTPQIQEIIRECYQVIVEHEAHIITTHLNTFRNTGHQPTLAGARKRLEHIKKEYLHHTPASGPFLAEIEARIEQASPQLPLTKPAA